jgi:hypothetical protein
MMVFWCVLVCAFSSVSSAGQGAASITGTVQDTTAGVVVGATVTVKDASGQSKTAVSSDQGEYTVDGLAPGTYTVTVSATGFKDFVAAGTTLAAGQALRLDATLEPTTVTSSVNVEGQTSGKVETESAQIAGSITGKELQKIGLNGRNFTQLITLAPGVSNQTGQDEAKVGVKGSVKYSVNGGRVEYNTFEVDGSDVLNPSVNGSESVLIVTPSLDALSDVQVLTSNYGAQYGRSASGTIIASTKTGGSEFHGDGYYFIRNEFFNARNFFDAPHKTPLYRKHDVGFTIGGPLYIPGHYNTKKDKTFGFWSEEWRSEREPQQFNRGVPTVAERTGNFSDVCPFAQLRGSQGDQVDFRPAQFPDCPNVGPSFGHPGFLTTYPGNQIGTVAPVAQAILNAGVIPLPNSDTGCNSSIHSCYVAAISPDTYWRQELGRIDHNFSAKVKGTIRYIHDEWDTIVATPQWSYLNNSFPTVQNRFYGPGVNVVGHLTNTVTNTLLNDLSFSYSQAHIQLRDINGPGANIDRTAAEPAISALGYIFNLTGTDFGGKLPSIVIGGTNAAYGGAGFALDTSYMPWTFSNPTYSLREELGKVTSKHFVQMGFQYLLQQRNEVNPPVGANTGDTQGLLTFVNQNTINLNQNVGATGFFGNAFANFLIGTASIKSFTQDSAQKKYYNRYQAWEPYLQDTWHVTSRLTINAGIRISLFQTYHEKYKNAYNWDPTKFDPALFAGTAVNPVNGQLYETGSPAGCLPQGAFGGGVRCTTVPLDLNNLDPRLTNGLVRCGTGGVPDGCQRSHLFNPAPRIGFAWDPIGNGKVSIRAGYGIFFEHGTSNEANTGSLEGSAPLVLNMTQLYPNSYECVGGVGGQGNSCNSLPGAFPVNVTAIQTKAVWPYAQQWSLSVQTELPHSFVATVAYVGSKGTHLATELQLNQLRPVSSASNPFGPGEPLTALDCSSGGSLLTGLVFTLANGTVVQSGDPGYTNLAVACGSLGANQIQPNAFRTFAPGFGQIYFLGNIADSRYNGLQASLRRTKGPLILSASYSYSHSIDDSSDRMDSTFVNAFDLPANKASSNFDQRHLLNVSYIYDFSFRKLLPLSRWADKDPTNELSRKEAVDPDSTAEKLKRVLDNWQISGIATFQSGTPFTIINGGSSTGLSALDNAGVANGTGAGSYPDVVGDPTSVPVYGHGILSTIGPLLGNPGAFIAPRGLTFGNAGRNFFNNPSRINFDVAFLRSFTIRESMSMEFRAEVFNIFNHTQFRIYNANLGNTASNTVTCYGGPNNSAAGGLNADGTVTDCLTGNSFLHPVDAHRPRTMQFGLKLFF